MARRAHCGFLLAGAAAAALAAGAALADVPRVHRLRPSPAPAPPADSNVLAGESIALFPETTPQEPAPAQKPRAERLQLQSRLELIRYIQGEFARAVATVPGGKKGFRFKAGEPLNQEDLRRAVGSSVPAANPGDTVQITGIEFREQEIWIEINGGGKKKKSWKERIQVSVGSGPPVSSTSSSSGQQGPPGFQGIGSTLIVDYARPLPDLTPDEFKQHLGVFLDFSGQRSAAVHWIETLPPEFQEAIKEQRAMVGMDREMVVAALGKPEKKVRERDLDGLETEDWIYGHPPAKTVFVKFAGEKVISVKEFPN
jgi:hypothetical protein